jgi:hypothetical protein
MKENNLVRINGVLQSRPDFSAHRKRVRNEDIPDYDKIKQAENPLESVV